MRFPADFVEAVVASGSQQPGLEVERIEPGQMTPKAQQDFLGRVLGVGLIGQQRARVAINLVTMPFTQDFEFQFTNHPVSRITNQRPELLQEKASVKKTWERSNV